LGKALPEGTVRRTGKGWEEVQVPPAQTTKLEQRLVQISELPEHAQLAFRGVHALNALQSAVVGVALHSNENMLVCAPTGAGKTNVALLAMMQQVRVCCPEGGVGRGKGGRGAAGWQLDGDEVGEVDPRMTPACF
jgi:superfamily II DNA/RNA helicase